MRKETNTQQHCFAKRSVFERLDDLTPQFNFWSSGEFLLVPRLENAIAQIEHHFNTACCKSFVVDNEVVIILTYIETFHVWLQNLTWCKFLVLHADQR